MGLGCKLNMSRWGLPSVHSPFSTNSSPLCCPPSIRGKELDLGSARLSLFTIGFDENELLHRDSSRPHSCCSSAPQTVENDYSNMEMMINERSSKGLHNMVNDAQVPSDKDTSAFVRSVQASSGSHFHLLMENIKVLENRMADTDLVKLEKEIIEQLQRLGALELFHRCLSRTLEDSTFTDISNFPAELIEDCQVKERIENQSTKTMVTSKRKEERKARSKRRMKTSSKKSFEDSMQTLFPSEANKTKAMAKRMTVSKNEAELSKGIKVVAKLERVKETLEKETGRAVSLSSWTEAAGIEEEELQHSIRYGWYCRDQLVRSGRSLVMYLARNYRGLGVAFEDLIQAGNIGLLQGAERFDHTRGYQFCTYVKYWIRRAMFQSVSRHGRGIKVPSTLSTAINRVHKARKTLKGMHGRSPDDIELAKFTGLSVDKIKSADKCLRVVGSIDQRVGDLVDIKFMECTPDTSIEMPEKAVIRDHLRNDINNLLKGLDPKERRVLILRYGFGGHCMSLHEIGKIFHSSKEWIRKLEKRALTKLKNDEVQRRLRHYMDP